MHAHSAVYAFSVFFFPPSSHVICGKATDGTRDQSYTQEGCAARSRQGSVARVSKQRAHSVAQERVFLSEEWRETVRARAFPIDLSPTRKRSLRSTGGLNELMRA